MKTRHIDLKLKYMYKKNYFLHPMKVQMYFPGGILLGFSEQFRWYGMQHSEHLTHSVAPS